MRLLPILMLVTCTSACASDWVLVRVPGEAGAAQFHRASLSRTQDQASLWVRTLRTGPPGREVTGEPRTRLQVALVDVDCRGRSALLRGVGYLSDDDEPTVRHQLGPIASRDWMSNPLRDSLVAIACG